MRREVKVGTVKLGPEERRNILKVMDSNQVSPGPFVKEFEKKFAQYHDCEYGVMMNSGTDALRIALLSLKEKYNWPDGSEVIVPALTFVATSNIVIQCGLTPVFVDVSATDLNIDVDLMTKNLFFRTRCVIPVHLFGRPANMNLVMIAAGHADVRVIEDSCECMGVRQICGWGSETKITSIQKRQIEKSVGSHGDIACFSTYACHLIQTGVGGIATTNQKDLNDLMRSYMNHGRRSEAREDRFTFDRIGYSSRPTEFEAAIGMAQLGKLKQSIAKRRENAGHLTERLSGHQESLWLPPLPEIATENAWMMFPIILNDKAIDRDEFCGFLNDKGVETRPLFPLLTQPCYKTFSSDKYYAERFPVALNASQHGFYVGCHDQLHEEDMAYVAMNIHYGLRKFSKEKFLAVA